MALQYALREYVAFFFFYSALGWVGEVAFAALTERQLVNRGFLNGPLCPLYGSGMVLMLLLFGPLAGNPVVVYFGGMLVTTAVEWAAGALLFRVFNTRWWDYSMYRFNLGGHVCLRFSLIWGIGSLVLVMGVHPLVARGAAAFPRELVLWADAIALTLFAADLAVSVAAAFGLNEWLTQLEEARAALRWGSDLMATFVGANVMSADEMLDEKKLQLTLALMEGRENAAEMQQQMLRFRTAALEKYRLVTERLDRERFFGAGRLLRAFPDLKSVRHNESVVSWRAHAAGLAGKAKHAAQTTVQAAGRAGRTATRAAGAAAGKAGDTARRAGHTVRRAAGRMRRLGRRRTG